MKASVLVAKDGSVLATRRHDVERKAGSPDIVFSPVKGQAVHEIDLTPALQKLSSADALHEALKSRIKRAPAKKKAKTSR